MTLEQQCCSLELAKRLKELGVKQESLFYWELFYSVSEKFDKGVSLGKKGEFGDDYHIVYHPRPSFTTADIKWNAADLAKLYDTGACAFTVAELGEILKSVKKIDFQLSDTHISEDWGWGAYYYPKGHIMAKAYSKEKTEADSRGKILVYLLEKRLITLNHS